MILFPLHISRLAGRIVSALGDHASGWSSILVDALYAKSKLFFKKTNIKRYIKVTFQKNNAMCCIEVTF